MNVACANVLIEDLIKTFDKYVDQRRPVDFFEKGNMSNDSDAAIVLNGAQFSRFSSPINTTPRTSICALRSAESVSSV